MHDGYEALQFFMGAGLEEYKAVAMELYKQDPDGLLEIVRGLRLVRTPWTDEVHELLRNHKKIDAIKVWRQNTGDSLKDAKDRVEEIQVQYGY